MQVSPSGSTTGITIIQIVSHSPAEAAGLQVGDIITAVDAAPVVDGRKLQRLVFESPPGRTFQLTVQREGRQFTLPVTLGELPD